MTVLVAKNDAEFAAARSAAVDGDAIQLTGSNYAAFRWDKQFGSTVTVFCADPNNIPAIGTVGLNAIKSNGAANIRYENLNLHRPYKAGDSDLKNTVDLDNTTNISFQKCEITGGIRTGDNAVIGRGVNGAGNNGTSLNECLLHGLTKGLTGGFNDLKITLTEFTRIRSDGLTLGGSTKTLIDRCYFHDFVTVPGSKAHPDFIQIQRSSGRGFHGFTFTHNVLDVGMGNYAQLLFSGNSGQANNATTRHSGWKIAHNIIYGDHSNMCVGTWVDGIEVANNTIIRVEAGNNGGTDSSMSLIDCTGVKVNLNVVAAIKNQQPHWDVSENVLVDKPAWLANFTILATTPQTLANHIEAYSDFEIKAGGAVHTAMAGAWIGKREGGWNGFGVEPHPNYPGGFRNTPGQVIKPKIVSFNPPAGATNVPVGSDIELVFDRPIAAHVGEVVLNYTTPLNDWFPDEVFDVVNDAGTQLGEVEISGSTMKLRPTAEFAFALQYSITIDPGAIKDFDGFDDPAAYSFTTEAAVAPPPPDPDPDPALGIITILVE